MADMKLKNCPFCGGEAKIDSDTNPSAVYIGCDNCEVRPHSWYQKSFPQWRDEAIEAWNKRSDSTIEAQEAEIKRLREDVSMLWMLLDDIDTLDDAAKDDDSVFRKACYKIQQKRWKIKDPFFMEQAALNKGE